MRAFVIAVAARSAREGRRFGPIEPSGVAPQGCHLEADPIAVSIAAPGPLASAAARRGYCSSKSGDPRARGWPATVDHRRGRSSTTAARRPRSSPRARTRSLRSRSDSLALAGLGPQRQQGHPAIGRKPPRHAAYRREAACSSARRSRPACPGTRPPQRTPATVSDPSTPGQLTGPVGAFVRDRGRAQLDTLTADGPGGRIVAQRDGSRADAVGSAEHDRGRSRIDHRAPDRALEVAERQDTHV